MNTLIFAINAIFPIIILIGLGYILRKIHFLDDLFFSSLNKFVFRIALPVLLFYNIYAIESFKEIDWYVILFSVTGLLFLFIVGLIIAPILTKDNRQKGVILQGVFRSNFAIIGLPLAASLGGIEAAAMVTLISAFAIPLMNLLSVISLTMYLKDEHGQTISISKFIIRIIKNPLIIGVFLGLFALFVRGFIPVNLDGQLVFSIKNHLVFIYQPIIWLSVIASPLALIALGGQFQFTIVRSDIKMISISVLIRNFLIPLTMLFAAVFVSRYHPDMIYAYAALIALFAAPNAVSSVVMAYELGSDHKLAAQLVVWSTILSILSLFTIIVIFRMMGAL